MEALFITNHFLSEFIVKIEMIMSTVIGSNVSDKVCDYVEQSNSDKFALVDSQN